MGQVSDQIATNGGQEPQAQPAPQDGGQRDYEAEIRKLRDEAAKWRTQYRDAEGQLKELSPLAQRAKEIEEQQKTEAEKLAERLAGLQSELDQQKAAAALAAKTARLTKLAAAAGVPATMLDYLDVTRFSDDDAEALEALKAIIPAPAASNGKTTNAGRTGLDQQGSTEDELRAWYQGKGRKNYIFGG